MTIKIKCWNCGLESASSHSVESYHQRHGAAGRVCDNPNCTGAMAILFPALQNDTKPTNPKDAVGANKVPLHLFPPTAVALGSMALLDGALKYGRMNYRAVGVRASIYVDALSRHITHWMEGEDLDPDSGQPHLGHAIACLAVLIDAQAAGKLTDDRNIAGGYRAMMDALTPAVAELKAKHSLREVKHYTIADNPAESWGGCEGPPTVQ